MSVLITETMVGGLHGARVEQLGETLIDGLLATRPAREPEADVAQVLQGRRQRQEGCAPSARPSEPHAATGSRAVCTEPPVATVLTSYSVHSAMCAQKEVPRV